MNPHTVSDRNSLREKDEEGIVTQFNSWWCESVTRLHTSRWTRKLRARKKAKIGYNLQRPIPDTLLCPLGATS